jgi:hypothetical protein
MVIFVGYSEFHEKDVYKIWHLATNKTLISRDVIWLNTTYSEHMDITKVNFMNSEVEEEEGEFDQELNKEQEGPLIYHKILTNIIQNYLLIPLPLPSHLLSQFHIQGQQGN